MPDWTDTYARNSLQFETDNSFKFTAKPKEQQENERGKSLSNEINRNNAIIMIIKLKLITFSELFFVLLLNNVGFISFYLCFT